jgi:tetratricopeptide (TPR) repeat protein
MNHRPRAMAQTRLWNRWTRTPNMEAKRMGFFRMTCALFLLLTTNDQAQFTSAGQAKSREEFDAYLVVLTKTSPKEVISAAGDFEQLWPHSELLGQVLELQLNAYRSVGDSAHAILAGERALKAVPDNLVILGNLAYLIANSTSDPQQLARAEEYARRELERSRTILAPKKISPEEWSENQSRLGSTAHAALGLVSYKRGDLAGAIREFETAVKLAPAPDPAQYYRLGILYRASGNQSKAVEMFHRAAETNDPTVRPLAERELKSLPH